MHAVPKEHRVSTKHFFDTGIFHSTTNAKELTRQNVNWELNASMLIHHGVSVQYSIGCVSIQGMGLQGNQEDLLR